MDESQLPGWAYPTREAKKLHYFRGRGEVTPCRKYVAGMPALLEPPVAGVEITAKTTCAVCWRHIQAGKA